MSDSRFAGKLAIVTGGASGMGEATVRRLAAEGATVIVADINGDASERVAAAVRADGGGAAAHVVDVSNEPDVNTSSGAATEVMRWAIQAPPLATVDQQAAAVAFLASDDASYLNGHTIPVETGSAIATTMHILLRYAQGQGILPGIGFGQPARPA